mmetsp:Transcript_36347/g.103967  ORF Transcript_36347/g.103967 Transcript_36347/m.103967 type:complete len:243 (-) Transcript_36347:874-1602(-)
MSRRGGTRCLRASRKGHRGDGRRPGRRQMFRLGREGGHLQRAGGDAEQRSPRVRLRPRLRRDRRAGGRVRALGAAARGRVPQRPQLRRHLLRPDRQRQDVHHVRRDRTRFCQPGLGLPRHERARWAASRPMRIGKAARGGAELPGGVQQRAVRPPRWPEGAAPAALQREARGAPGPHAPALRAGPDGGAGPQLAPRGRRLADGRQDGVQPALQPQPRRGHAAPLLGPVLRRLTTGFRGVFHH